MVKCDGLKGPFSDASSLALLAERKSARGKEGSWKSVVLGLRRFKSCPLHFFPVKFTWL